MRLSNGKYFRQKMPVCQAKTVFIVCCVVGDLLLQDLSDVQITCVFFSSATCWVQCTTRGIFASRQTETQSSVLWEIDFRCLISKSECKSRFYVARTDAKFTILPFMSSLKSVRGGCKRSSTRTLFQLDLSATSLRLFQWKAK